MNASGGASWAKRIIDTLALNGIQRHTRDSLVDVLGVLGCEAEYALSFLQPARKIPFPTFQQGEIWLSRCYQLSKRLADISIQLELATQQFLNEFVCIDTTLSAGERDSASFSGPATDAWSAQFDATPDIWWQDAGEITVPTESIEIWLRRAGFGYRHIIAVKLPDHIEAMETTLRMIFTALHSLPPAGVLPNASLYIGLVHISGEFCGDLVPHHLHDLDKRHVGLLTALTTIRRMGPSALEPDIIWAQDELDRARQLLAPVQTAEGRITRPLARTTGNLFVQQMIREWELLITQLQQMQYNQGINPSFR